MRGSGITQGWRRRDGSLLQKNKWNKNLDFCLGLRLASVLPKPRTNIYKRTQYSNSGGLYVGWWEYF